MAGSRQSQCRDSLGLGACVPPKQVSCLLVGTFRRQLLRAGPEVAAAPALGSRSQEWLAGWWAPGPISHPGSSLQAWPEEAGHWGALEGRIVPVSPFSFLSASWPSLAGQLSSALPPATMASPWALSSGGPLQTEPLTPRARATPPPLSGPRASWAQRREAG